MPNLATKSDPKPPPPTSLRECLAPLAAAALQTSIAAYKWGLQNGTLFRASTVMDLCDAIVKESNKILAHEASSQATAQTAAAQQNGQK